MTASRRDALRSAGRRPELRFGVVALITLAGVLAGAPPVAAQEAGAASADVRLVAEIRVHGNHRIADEEVLALAGIAVGDELESRGELAVEERLIGSGRFASVRVLVRYRNLEQRGPVVLIVSVQEKESVASKLLFLPELRFSEDEKFSYGGRVSARNLLGGDEFLSLPLTWGGVRRAALEGRKDWDSGLAVGGQIETRRWENSHFELIDRRTGGSLFVEKRLGESLALRVHAARYQVVFAELDERLGSVGARLQFDTRPDPGFAYDSVFVSAGLDRLFAGPEADGVERFRVEAAAYRMLVGPAVLAVRGWLQRSSGPLPAYERVLVGGRVSLRGWRAGSFSGDNAALGTVELRVPLTSPLGVGRAGIALFWDTASVWDDGHAFNDAERYHGVGAGLFTMLPGLRLNLDVASNLRGEIRVHFGTGFRF